MDYLLGLDVGTTATKALLFDVTGVIIASATYSYALITPHPGWVEQDPEELWRGVVKTCRSVMRQVGPGDRVLALCQASQGGTTIPADAGGQPIGNAISWMDERGGAQRRHVKEMWGEEFIRTTTGWPLFNGLPLQHIGWLRDRRPDEFKEMCSFLFVNDFIGRRLTGERCMNPSDASITQLYNIREGDWDERLLKTVGVRRDQLSPVRPSGCVVGEVTEVAGETTGLPPGTLVVNGAHDQYCAAVGTGATRPGRVMLSCGTAWVILAVPESLQVGLRSRMGISRHAVEGHWGAIRSLGGVGTSLEWFLDNVWCGGKGEVERESLYDAVSASAGRSIPGSNGLLFYPLAGGHGADFGPGRGGFVGLSLAHSRDDLARAVMEGITFELRWAIDEVGASGIEMAELKMVGGAAGSAVWPSLVADITGIPVTLPAAGRHAAVHGAAILAGIGAGLFEDADVGLRTFSASAGKENRLEPSLRNRELYEATFARYRSVWPAIAQAAA